LKRCWNVGGEGRREGGGKEAKQISRSGEVEQPRGNNCKLTVKSATRRRGAEQAVAGGSGSGSDKGRAIKGTRLLQVK
jgi:hypothetical protein